MLNATLDPKCGFFVQTTATASSSRVILLSMTLLMFATASRLAA